jgi:hypothetical protein
VSKKEFWWHKDSKYIKEMNSLKDETPETNIDGEDEKKIYAISKTSSLFFFQVL